MKKINSVFTKSLPSVLKKSDRLICQPAGENFLLCNGFAMWQLSPAEYDAIARPALHCDAGHWEIVNGCRKDTDFDVLKMWEKYTDLHAAGNPAAEAAARFTTRGGKNLVAFFYGDIVATYDSFYADTVTSGAVPFIKDKISPVVIADPKRGPVAFIMPVKITPEIEAAVKAMYGIQPPATDKEKEYLQRIEEAENDRMEAQDAASVIRCNYNKLSAKYSALEAAAVEESAALRDQLAAAQAATEAAQAEAAALRAELEALKADNKPAPAADQEKPSAERIVERFSSIPGLTVAVHGAKTAAPVIWFGGAAEDHAEALKAAGARFSVRRNAYYIKIA